MNANPNYIDVDDVRIAYERAGASDAPVLVCVHGNFASRNWFRLLLEEPPEGWGVVALDLPNFGMSDPMPDAISIEAYARYLNKAMQALDLEQPVMLGHSFGGAVVMMAAASQRVDLRALVLMASAPVDGLISSEQAYKVLRLMRGNRLLIEQALSPTMSGKHPSIFTQLVSDAMIMQSEAFTENARALERYDLSHEMQKFKAPVLVLGGVQDYLIKPDMLKRTAAAFPNAELIMLEGVGHSPQFETPQFFKLILKQFLDKVITYQTT